jgi:hypothetical protein
MEPYTISAVGATKDTFDGQTWTRATLTSAMRLARTIVKLGAVAQIYENGQLIRTLTATNG